MRCLQGIFTFPVSEEFQRVFKEFKWWLLTPNIFNILFLRRNDAFLGRNWLFFFLHGSLWVTFTGDFISVLRAGINFPFYLIDCLFAKNRIKNYSLGSNISWQKILLWSPRCILWKSYMLSCLTKDGNLLCLKYRGRTASSSLFWFSILMPLSCESQVMALQCYLDLVYKQELLWECCRVWWWKRRLYLSSSYFKKRL